MWFLWGPSIVGVAIELQFVTLVSLLYYTIVVCVLALLRCCCVNRPLLLCYVARCFVATAPGCVFAKHTNMHSMCILLDVLFSVLVVVQFVVVDVE